MTDPLSGLTSVSTVERLASSTKNVQLRAQEARDAYNRLNAELEQAYTEANRLARSTEGVNRSFDLRDAETNAQAFLKALEKVEPASAAAKAALDEYKASVVGSSGSMDKAITAVERLGVVSEQDAAHLRALRGEYEGVSSTFDAFKRAASFEEMGVDISEATASINGMSRSIAELRAPTGLQRSFADVDAQVQLLDTSTEALTGHLRSVDEALEMDPGNVELVAERERDLSQLAENAARKQELLQQKVDGMTAAGVEDAGRSMGELAAETQRADGALGKAQAGLSAAEGEANRARQAVENAQRAVRDFEESQGKGAQSAEEHASALARARQELSRSRADYSSAQAEVERLSASEREASEAYKAAKNSEQLAETRKSLMEARTEAERLSKEMGASPSLMGVFSGLYDAGIALSTTVTPAMVAVGRSAVESANEVDSAYRDMRKTVDGTEEQFQALRDGAIEFSQTHFTSADQLMEIEAIGGELGIAADGLQTFAETVSNIDIATDLDTETAAQDLGQLANIMGDLDESTMPNFSDSLVRLGNNGASTESSIMDVAKRIGSMGSILGFTTPQVLAWASSIASTGQESEAAGTAISKTMSDIETAVSAGGDSLQAFADVAGMSAEDFASTWKGSPSEAMEAFVKGLVRVEQDGGSADATLQALGITGTRQKQALEGLMQTIGGLDDNLRMSQDAWDGLSDEWGQAGDAAREADAKAQGFSGTVQRMRNVAQNLGADLGDAMLPFMQKLASVIEALSGWFEGLPDPIKRCVVVMGGLAAVAGPTAFVIGRMGQALLKLTGVAEGAATATKILALGLTGLKFLGVVAAISAVVAITATLVDQWQKAKEHEERFARATEDVGSILGGVSGDVESAADAYADLRDASERALDSMGQANDKARESFEDVAVNAAKLDAAVQTIEELGSKSELTAYEQQKLKDAVKTYNDVTGESVEVTDAASGEISESTDELKRNASAWKRNAEAQAIAAAQQEYLQQQIEATVKLQEAQEDLASARSAREGVEAQRDKLVSDISAKGGIPAATPEESEALDDLNDQLAELSQNEADAQAAIDNYSGQLETATKDVETLTNMQSMLDQTYEKLGDDADSVFADAGVDVNEFANALGAAGVSADDFARLSGDTLRQVLQDSGGDATAAAERIKEIAGATSDWSATIGDLMGQSQELSDALGEMGVDADALAERLGAAGVSTDTLGKLGATAFENLARSCDGNVDEIVARLKQINDSHIDTKTLTVTDDGSLRTSWGALVDLDAMTIADKRFSVTDDGTVFYENGVLTDFQSVQVGDKYFSVSDQGTVALGEGLVMDLNSMTIDGKSFYVTDQGTIAIEGLGVLDLNSMTIDGKSFTVTDDGTISLVEGRVEEVDRNEIAPKQLEITEDGSVKVNRAIDSVNNNDPKPKSWPLGVNDYATPEIDRVQREIDGMHGKNIDVYVTTHHQDDGKPNARGGVAVYAHAAGGIMAHAAGAYLHDVIRSRGAGAIATGPTMLDPHNLVGEAGAEAIVPLTNRRYVRPFADSVAEGVVRMMPDYSRALSPVVDLLRDLVSGQNRGGVYLDGDALVGELAAGVAAGGRMYGR